MSFWELMIYLVISGSLLFVLLCVSPYGTGPVSFLSRVFYVYIPRFTYRAIIKIFGVNGTNKIKYYAMYIFNEPNPFFQIIYLALSVGGYLIYYLYGFPYIPNPMVSEYHMYIGSFLYFVALMTFILASIVPPGVITKQNVKDHLLLFKFDNMMFKPSDCPTCKLPKPARSKHCSVCEYCVSKHDHHCIWINQCVGYSNYKYFLAFILSHSLICLYAGQVGFFILMHIANKDKLFSAVFTDKYGNQFQSSMTVIFQYLLQRYPAFMFVIVLCVLMGIVLGGFFIYHLYMAGKNLTTNERIKVMKLEENGNTVSNIYDLGFWKNIHEVLDAAEF